MENKENSWESVQEGVFDKCLKLIRDREESYGNSWETEELDYLHANIRRKYLGFQFQRDHGKKIINEDLLDLINYIAFLYLRLNRGF